MEKDCSKLTKQEELIVFTNENELSKYNEKLLQEFIFYLNHRQKQKHDVFHCGFSTQILSEDILIKDFLKRITLE